MVSDMVSFSDHKTLDRQRLLIQCLIRLASVGTLGKEREREPRVGKLVWHGNFDTGFERNTLISYFVQNPVCGFFNFF